MLRYHSYAYYPTMTSQPTSDTSILSIGDPILNSTAILRHSILDDTGLPFPSFLTNPDESDDEDTSQPTIPTSTTINSLPSCSAHPQLPLNPFTSPPYVLMIPLLQFHPLPSPHLHLLLHQRQHPPSPLLLLLQLPQLPPPKLPPHPPRSSLPSPPTHQTAVSQPLTFLS